VALACALPDSFLIDCDRQQSALVWASGGLLPCRVGTIADGLKASCQNLLIDSEARLGASQLRDAVAAADVVLVPCQLSAIDLDSTALFLASLRPMLGNRPAYAIASMVHPSAKPEKTMAAFDGFPWAETVIRRRSAWQQAALRQCPLSRISGAGARRAEAEVAALIREVLK
jgi:cellulose biosynthesis protein BcsQ